jgi:hypothetical protein
MKIWNKIKFKLKFLVNIAIDGVFLVLWALLTWIIHQKFLPWLGLDGLHGDIINGVAIAFEIITALLCIYYIIVDMKDDIYEHKKSR